jgi:adenylosuccinate synthase
VNETGKYIREAGREYGSTTGRPRRCGWLDLVGLKYSVMLNGVAELIMMKTDVLDQFTTLRICVGYEIDGIETETFPHELTDNVKPVYIDLPGWKTDITHLKSQDEFPEELNNYISFIEEEVGLPITIVSVGANRNQTIFLENTEF